VTAVATWKQVAMMAWKQVATMAWKPPASGTPVATQCRWATTTDPKRRYGGMAPAVRSRWTLRKMQRT